jgi:hypothetical protein
VFAVGPKDDAILRAIARYAYLKIDQLGRLLPPTERPSRTVRSEAKRPEPERYLRNRCQALYEHEFLRRRYLPQAPNVTEMDQAPKGKPPLVYWLGSKGEDYLEGLSVPYIDPPRPSEVHALAYQYLVHHLSANDLLISADLLARARADLWVADALPPRALNLQPVPIVLPDGAKSTTTPDAWARFHFGEEDSSDHQAIAFELDNGTEGPKAWRDKLTRLIAYAVGPYQQWSGTTSLTIAVVATPGAKREQQLRAWTESFLTSRFPKQQERQVFAGLFRFAAFEPGRASPEQAYLHPVWRTPFDTQVRPLLELEGGA